MRLRAYCEDTDFDIIRSWDTDERSHALWCANLIPYPLTKEGLGNTITRLSSEYGEEPYTAVDDDGRPVGFFRYSVRREERLGKLKFVIVDSSLRGRGFGEEMISLACEMAFSRMDVDAVELNVFPENAGAVRCYEKAGFARVREDDAAFEFGGEKWGNIYMINDIWKRMYEAAAVKHAPRDVSPFVYAFNVVCAIEAGDGRIYTGTCIEALCGTVSLCAERVAAVNMLNDSGQTLIRRMMVFRDRPPVREDKDNMPCGVCREFLMQLNHKNAGMQIMVDLPSRETVTLGELIPRWCFEDRLTD